MIGITVALGGCFLAIRWGLRDASPLWFAALRAGVAAAALAAVAAVQRRPLPRSLREWGEIALLGLVNVSLVFAAMFLGVAGLATGTAAVLSNAQPLLILLPAWFLYGEKPSRRVVLAMLVGFTGLMIVAVPGGGGTGAMLALTAALAVTVGTLLVRRLHSSDVVVVSAVHLGIGAAALVVLALIWEGPADISWTPRFVAMLGYLGVIATAGATMAWFIEVQRASLASVTAWMLLVPVVGVVLGVLVLGERLTGWTAAGVLIVLASLVVVLRPHGGREIFSTR
jgi:drug/metabolite transporter (DMT)-like permease